MGIYTKKMLKELNNIFKYVILILLILLAVVSVYYKYDNCSICSFDYQGNKLTAKEFMDIFAEDCLHLSSPQGLMDYSPIFENITIANSSG